MTDEPLIVLRDNPLIAKIEAQMGVRGILWNPAFEQECDVVSRALFGLTAAETRWPEPHPDQFAVNSSYRFGEEQFASYAKALHAWQVWDANMDMPNAKHETEAHLRRYWDEIGFDVHREDGRPLGCLECFERQMVAAMYELTPAARLTMDGSGVLAKATPEAWGAALEAEAARFKALPRR